MATAKMAPSRAGSGTNDRRGGDADLGSHLPTPAVVGRRLAGRQQSHFPDLRAGIRIERIQAVVLGGRDQHIMWSLVRDSDPGDVKRLGVHQTVQCHLEEFAE